MSLFFGNCQTAEIINYYLTANPTGFTLGGTGEAAEISVSSNDAWGASTGDDWIRIDSVDGVGDGTVMFHVEPNTDALSRQGSIIITGAGTSVTIEVYQNPA